MKDRHRALGRLSDAEAEVMRVIWELTPPVTVSGLLEIFRARRGWKTSTLSTVMDRLIEKGFLSKALRGKTNLYTALVTEDYYKELETRTFIESVHKGSVKSFIAALAEGDNITADEIDEIKAWFTERTGDEE